MTPEERTQPLQDLFDRLKDAKDEKQLVERCLELEKAIWAFEKKYFDNYILTHRRVLDGYMHGAAERIRLFSQHPGDSTLIREAMERLEKCIKVFQGRDPEVGRILAVSQLERFYNRYDRGK